MWTGRQFLESLTHAENCFITLTYADDTLPEGETLVPEHCTLFLKRLRKSVYPLQFRYYLVGEYGDNSNRPHYHLSAFGLGQFSADIVNSAWGKGHTLTAEFNAQTAQYVAGYTVKKMTAKDDPRLKGRHPEFSRKSNRPGLGAPAMDIIADTLRSHNLADAPRHLLVGKKKLMLDRYLLRKLREALNIDEETVAAAKQDRVWELCSEMQALWNIARSDPNKTKEALSPKHSLVAANLGLIQSAEGRHSRINKGKL